MLSDEQYDAAERKAEAATDQNLPCVCMTQHPDAPSGCPSCDTWIEAYDEALDGYEAMLDKAQVLNMHQLSKPSELELEQAAVERMVKEGRHESPCLITYLAIERQGRNFTA